MTLEDLLIKHGAASFDKQIYFDAMLGKAGWGIDLSTGVIGFRRPHEDVLQLNFQVLGTESDDSRSWLWAWANTGQGFGPDLLVAANELRGFGEKHAVSELNTPELPLSERVNGARLSAIASGVCRAGCTFRASYPGGRLFLLIRDPRFKRPVSQPIQRILRAFPLFLADGAVADHRAALLAYAQFYKLEIEESTTRISARTSATARTAAGLQLDNTLVAEFDAAGRLIRLGGSTS
jgi:hypothetical protein